TEGPSETAASVLSCLAFSSRRTPRCTASHYEGSTPAGDASPRGDLAGRHRREGPRASWLLLLTSGVLFLERLQQPAAGSLPNQVLPRQEEGRPGAISPGFLLSESARRGEPDPAQAPLPCAPPVLSRGGETAAKGGLARRGRVPLSYRAAARGRREAHVGMCLAPPPAFHLPTREASPPSGFVEP